jgi:RND family efflux transporter MFP subunit
MNLKKSILLAILAIYLIACSNKKTPDLELSSSDNIGVKVYHLQKSEGEVIINSTGILTTENDAKYSFKIGGVIDRIYVREGEYFKKGRLLASLKIDEIDAGYIQAKLGVEKAERDLRRIKNLYQDSVATLEQFQNTKTVYEIAKKQLDAVTFNKKFAYIYASDDGFVAKKLANEGEIISGGMPVLAINENHEDAWVLKVGLADKDWTLVEVGNTAQIILDAYPDKIFTGKVCRKSLSADVGGGSFQVEVKVNFGNLNPAIGMFGKAIIATNAVQKYQSIPYDAVVEADGKHAYVFVPIAGGRVKRQAIEIGSFDNTSVQVKSGLENVKEVVYTNSAFLNENSKITIIK